MRDMDSTRRDALKAFAMFRRILAGDEPLDLDTRAALIVLLDATEQHLVQMWRLVLDR